MKRAKKRHENHIIDQKGEILFKSKLPSHWVVRDYKPDYGIDFSIEVFRSAGLDKKEKETFETLGEYFHVQLKSCTKVKRSSLEIFDRHNVEKAPESLQTDNPIGTIDIISFQIETSELVTIQRMGPAVPLLLIIADITEQECYFICLNDYIDKVLTPRYDDYTDASSRVVHIPQSNRLSEDNNHVGILRWYAKRAKLYAAFTRFHYQHIELEYALSADNFDELARYFARRIVGYDFWDDVEISKIITNYGDKVRQYHNTGRPNLMTKAISKKLSDLTNKGEEEIAEIMEQHRRDEVLLLWRGLSTLPRNLEDVWREWYLPTAIGVLCS